VSHFRFIHILMVLVYWAYVLHINVMNSKETLLDANWHESDKNHYMCVHRQNAHCSSNMKVVKFDVVLTVHRRYYVEIKMPTRCNR
jgi:predicted ferric reductase